MKGSAESLLLGLCGFSSLTMVVRAGLNRLRKKSGGTATPGCVRRAIPPKSAQAGVPVSLSRNLVTRRTALRLRRFT